MGQESKVILDYIGFEASTGYMKSCLNKQNKGFKRRLRRLKGLQA